MPRTTYPSELQEAHSLQRLPDIWDLIFEPGHAPLQVNLHELVFAVSPRPSLLISMSAVRIFCQVALSATYIAGRHTQENSRDHLLEAPQRRLHILARRYVILDPVNKGRKRDPSRVRPRRSDRRSFAAAAADIVATVSLPVPRLA